MSVLRFDSMQCERTRSQMDAYLSNELLVETTGEVLKHLENCPDCSGELEARSRVRGALRKAVATMVTPENLRPAVQRRIRSAQPSMIWGMPKTSWALAAALTIVVAAAGAAIEWRSVERGRKMVATILQLGVTDHLQCAIKGHNYQDAGRTQEELRRKLGAHFAGLIPVVEEELPGFQLLEAHICDLNGSPRKYVHFIARGQGTILSVILTRRDGASLPPGYFLKAGDPQGVDLFQTQLEGMHVAGFETNEYFGFVVADLGGDAVLRIARGIAPPLKHALDDEGGLASENLPQVHRQRRSFRVTEIRVSHLMLQAGEM